jgi:uncharacterized protein (TIGR00375 family)
MRFIADLHIHSSFSRATSREISLENIWKWAQFKGITVVGTGDFTHPVWQKELKVKLYNNGHNLFKLKNKYHGEISSSCKSNVFFMLTSEVSCIYAKKGKVRKIHNLIFVPDFAAASRVTKALARIGNLESDGRPILGLDARVLLRIVLDSSDNSMLVPAHAWTPHFSVFGASSGFDSLEECFEELTPNICAIETGLSSDPAMNWRLSSLDGITLISNSDAHSAAKLGREANIFDTAYARKKGKGGPEISYQFIMDAIKTKKGFLGTIEFFPEEGKYHYDGHRACGVSLSPRETIERNYLCPVCGKKVTVGVLHRVEKLADRREGFRPKGAKPFYSVIPLPEIIAETLKVGVNSKAVREEYFRLLDKLGSEFRILLDTPLGDIERAASPRLREAIERMRSGNVNITPGFDGEYGRVRIFVSSDFPVE